MKKVFRLWKLVEYNLSASSDHHDINLIIEALKTGWPQQCDGLTQVKMLSLGYSCNDHWCVLEE